MSSFSTKTYIFAKIKKKCTILNRFGVGHYHMYTKPRKKLNYSLLFLKRTQ